MTPAQEHPREDKSHEALRSRALEQLELLQKSLSPASSRKKADNSQHKHDQITSAATPTTQERQRQGYLDRLRSFRSSTYFAKPSRLSPIVVARFGWRNVDKDILKCEGCQAVVAIIFHPHLSKRATESLVDSYQSQMADSHSPSCPYRLYQQRHKNQPCFGHDHNCTDKTQENNVLAQDKLATCLQQQSPFPSSLFASVFSQREVELLEHVQPTKRLQTLVVELLQSEGQVQHIQPYQDIPFHIQSYPKTAASADAATDETQSQMLCCLTEMIFPKNETTAASSSKLMQVAAQVDRSVLETALLFVLFGWRIAVPESKEADDEKDKPKQLLIVVCPFCLASMAVPEKDPANQAEQDQDNENGGIEVTTHGVLLDQYRTWKRARTDARPWSAHKYYCPYVEEGCSFVGSNGNSAPLWQWLANKYLKVNDGSASPTHSHGDAGMEEQPQPSAWMQIHQMLSQGIADQGGKNDKKRQRRTE